MPSAPVLAPARAVVPSPAPVSRPGSPLLPAAGACRVLLGPDGVDARADIGIGTALTRQVASAGEGGWLRVYRPARTLAFSRRDSTSPGFRAAVEVARTHGFTPVIRAPGGRAVAMHERTVCVDLVGSDPDPRTAVTARFAETAELVVEALVALGVDARHGRLPREYCPGEHSVHAHGRKLAGIAQRLVRGGWLVGVAVTVGDSAPVGDVIGSVYAALGVDVDVDTVGAVDDVAHGTGTAEVSAAILDAARRRGIRDVAQVPGDLVDRGRDAAPRHTGPDLDSSWPTDRLTNNTTTTTPTAVGAFR